MASVKNSKNLHNGVNGALNGSLRRSQQSVSRQGNAKPSSPTSLEPHPSRGGILYNYIVAPYRIMFGVIFLAVVTASNLGSNAHHNKPNGVNGVQQPATGSWVKSLRQAWGNGFDMIVAFYHTLLGAFFLLLTDSDGNSQHLHNGINGMNGITSAHTATDSLERLLLRTNRKVNARERYTPEQLPKSKEEGVSKMLGQFYHILFGVVFLFMTVASKLEDLQHRIAGLNGIHSHNPNVSLAKLQQRMNRKIHVRGYDRRSAFDFGVFQTIDHFYHIIIGAIFFSVTTASYGDYKDAHNIHRAPPIGREKPAPLPKANRDGVTRTFGRYGQVTHVTPSPFSSQITNGTFGQGTEKGRLSGDWRNIRAKDLKTLFEVIKAKLTGAPLVDDRTMIMERVIQLVAGLPHGSRLREELSNNFINELWYTLDHPPLLYIGNEFTYRSADGSNNNPMNPKLGAAGSTYARTCRPGVVTLAALPDPALIFDTVMRRDEYKQHPNNVSSVLWYWATLVTHDLFWTDHNDMNKNMTSSYLDLSPLYGSNQDMQNSVRTFKGGLLKPDSFADKRLLGRPPGINVILVMFNRFHNYVAQNLANINENGRFTQPSPDLDEVRAGLLWKKLDEDLFQTARLITTGLYINITLVDYVRNIINLNRSNTTWTLDPRQEMGRDVGTSKGSERGTGNIVSAEFNLCYRWHSCMSEKDDAWTQDFWRDIFGGNDTENLSTREMMSGFVKFENSIPEDPGERVFGGFKRASDGRFNDDDLVNCISDAVEDVAGAFGGRNVPKVLKPAEILGILQARKWNVAGLNEFRRHFGLKPYEKFEDINSDPKIANSLRHLYEHPDFVELYPGLVAEEAKNPMVPGVGIAPTYTISRVILSDAVCLTRGDRFYTIDYNPRNLTNWGYTEVEYDLNVNQGCTFYKLFIRAFPNHFKENNVYAHYPMCIPSETKRILESLGRAADFSYERPTRTPERCNVVNYNTAKEVLADSSCYKTAWSEPLEYLLGAGARRCALSGDSKYHSTQRRILQCGLYRKDWHLLVKSFFSQMTDELISERSYILDGQRFVDIVRDVGNLAPTHFFSCAFNMPLQTAQNPKGVYTDLEMYMVLAVIHVCAFSDVDPVKSFYIRNAAKAITTQLGEATEVSAKSSTVLLDSYGLKLIHKLSRSGLSHKDIVWSHILPAASAAAPKISEAFAQAVDFYLSPEGQAHIPELFRIANLKSGGEGDELLLGYALEGLRLSRGSSTFRQAAFDGSLEDDNAKSLHIKAGSRVFVNFSGSTKNGEAFVTPKKVDPHRPVDSYLHLGYGPESIVGPPIVYVALTEMFRSVFKHRNVRRAPGPQGLLKKVLQPSGQTLYMREDWGALWPLPTSMKIAYDP